MYAADFKPSANLVVEIRIGLRTILSWATEQQKHLTRFCIPLGIPKDHLNNIHSVQTLKAPNQFYN